MQSIAINYSMYLMQEHNTKQYIVFIQRVYRFKLFCCCKSMIESELDFWRITPDINESGDRNDDLDRTKYFNSN